MRPDLGQERIEHVANLTGKNRLDHRRGQQRIGEGCGSGARGGWRDCYPEPAGTPREKLEGVARRIHNSAGQAHVQPADLTDKDQVRRVGDYIKATFNQLHILVNNAGVNIVDRHWDKLTPENIEYMVQGNPDRCCIASRWRCRSCERNRTG